MNKKIIYTKGPIRLWRFDYGRYSRPSFMVECDDREPRDFPAFDNPNNGTDALSYIGDIREELKI